MRVALARLLVIALPASAAGAATAGQLAVAQAQPAATLATARWVEFDANFVRTEPRARKVVGFFHRGADGSTREDSNVDGPARPVILITNVTTRLEYTFEGGVWTSYPLNLPPQGIRPETAKNPRSYTPANPLPAWTSSAS